MRQCHARQSALRHSLQHICLIALLWILTSCVAVPLQPASPPTEVLAGPLIGKTWRVEEATHQGVPVRFDWYQPLNLVFTSAGFLLVETPVWCRQTSQPIAYTGVDLFQLGVAMVPAIDCGNVILDQGYVDCTSLMGADADPEKCAEIVRQEYDTIFDALHATHQYVVAGDRLTLTGPDAEIRLVLEAP